MARYKYVITDKYGKEKKGLMESQSEEQAIARLKGDGSVVLNIKESHSLNDASWNIQIGTGVKKKDITVFCKQFYSILTAGVTVIDGLQMVQEQTENKNLQKALLNVQANVAKGESLAGAMEQEGKVFPELLIHMVRAGEATGNLEIAFERITSQFDKDMKLGSMVRSAMIYPIVVFVVAIAVVIILMTTVIPNFKETFETMGEELPVLTQMVVNISNFVTSHILGVLGTIAGLVIFILVGKGTEPGKQFLSRVALLVPMFKNFSVKNASARFSMTMATLVMSGVPLVDALEIAGDVISNRVIRKAVKDCREEVMQGIPMSEPLEASGVFPPMLTHMLRIGEETGTTEQMLDKVAEYYEEEVSVATKNLTTAMEPMIIVLLAVLVGGILGAVMMPMLSIYENAGNV